MVVSINGHLVADLISEGQTIVKLGVHLSSLSVHTSAFQNKNQKVVLLKKKNKPNNPITLSRTACYIMHQNKCEIIKNP